jgi:hypothetical protein
VVAVVLAAVAVGLSGLRTDTTPASFLPSHDPSIESLDDAARSFGGDPIVVLIESAQPRELLGGDEVLKLIKMEGQLSQLPNTAVVYGPGSVINQIAGSAQNLLATLSGKRDAARTEAEGQARSGGAPPEAVAGAGQAAVAQFDLRYGSLLVRGLPAGLPTVRNPAFVNTIVFDKVGAPRPEMRFVVPSPNAVAILIRPRQDLDQAGTEKLVDQARATVAGAGLKAQRTTVTGSPAVASELGTTVQREIPIVGGLAVGLIAVCYAAAPWTRRKRRRLLPLACTLSATALVLSLFGWLDRPLSLGVVTFLPILIGIGSDFPAYVVRGANRRVVVVTALASAAGFAALAFSPLPFVRDLGLALGAGVLLALGVSILLARYLSDPGDEPEPAAAEPASSQTAAPATGAPSTLPLLQRVGALVAVVAVAAMGWVALPQLNIQARPDELAAGLPAVADAQYAEGVLGSSGEVELLLRGNDVLSPQAIAWMRNAEDTTVLRYGSQLHPIVSVPDLLRFLGPDPTPDEITSALALVPPYRFPAPAASGTAGLRGRASRRGGARVHAGLRRSLPHQPRRHRRRRSRPRDRAPAAVGRWSRRPGRAARHRLGARRHVAARRASHAADGGARLADHGHRLRVHDLPGSGRPPRVAQAAAHGRGGCRSGFPGVRGTRGLGPRGDP